MESIKCPCGQRITGRDVVRKGLFKRAFGPRYVYIRFLCTNCRKLGEYFVKQKEWQDSLLSDSPPGTDA